MGVGAARALTPTLSPQGRGSRSRPAGFAGEAVAALGAHLLADLGFAARHGIIDARIGRRPIPFCPDRLRRSGRWRRLAERNADLRRDGMLGPHVARLGCTVARFDRGQQPWAGSGFQRRGSRRRRLRRRRRHLRHRGKRQTGHGKRGGEPEAVSSHGASLVKAQRSAAAASACTSIQHPRVGRSAAAASARAGERAGVSRIER